MNPAVDRTTYVWCAAAVGLTLIPLLRTLPAWLSLLVMGLVVVACVYGFRGRVAWLGLRIPLTLGTALAVLFAFEFRFGRDTGAALLTSMLALKLFELRRLRDARSVLSYSLFGLMAGFLLNQSPFTLALALIAMLLIVSALSRCADLELPSGAASPPGTVRDRLLATGRALVVSIPLAAAGFFLFPRFASPLWGMPDNAIARSGLSEEMSPGDIVSLFLDDSPVLRVQFDGEAPAQHQLYWRGPVLAHFDGRTWSRSRWSNVFTPARIVPLAPPVSYEVTQEPTDRHFLMTLDVPADKPESSLINRDRVVGRFKPQTELTRFRATSLTEYVFEPELDPNYRFAATDLPEGFNPRTRELIEGWLDEGMRGEAVAGRALALFNAEFRYTLTPALLGRDSVDDFVFNTQAGYCEHFASAFVVMMRFADIPARVVTGYQGGTLNDIGNYWVVRQSDAHAWAEIWLPSRGWVRIDPTSVVAPERIQRGSEALSNTAAWLAFARPVFEAGDWLRRSWNDMVLGFNATRQRSLLQPFGLDRASTAQLGVALAVGVAVALALTLALLLRTPAAPRDPLRAAYHRFLRSLARAGAQKAPHEGPMSFAARVARDMPDDAAGVLSLSQRYVLRRYAAFDAMSGDEAALRTELERFRPNGKAKITGRSS